MTGVILLQNLTTALTEPGFLQIKSQGEICWHLCIEHQAI